MVSGSQIGAYRVLHQIGEGGMGSVWLAEHAMLGRRAALKVLRPEYSHREEIVTRFFNEARAATSIGDPGIVQIFDFGQHTDGSAYIVMELLDGEPLDRRLERLGTLGLPDALRLMRQVASTLGAAHARGIVHRDLKPENIFIVRDPEVASGERAKVLDFGIAKLGGDQSGVKTQTAALMGTPVYMSPEQCRGAGGVDQRSDVYALGCVLFRLLCGRPPFEGEGVGEIIVKHMTEAAPAPSSSRPGIPREVDELVLRCLAKDPAQRFASGAELAIAIGALVGSSPQIAAPSAVYAVAAAPTTLSSATGASIPPTTGASPKKSSTKLVIGLAVAAVAAAGGFAVVKLHGGSKSTSPATSSSANAPAASPAPAPTSPPPHAPPAPPAPDPTAQVAASAKPVLARFVTWSHDHAGAPCPDIAALGGDANDPWGHPFTITCTDQPGDQIVGLISAGPDGQPRTADDVASWRLGHDVTDLVHGSRWVAAAPAQPSTPVARPGSRKHPASGTVHATKPASQPTGGVRLDENGLPITR
jgi:serine/threonine-protein kinase